jgi:hypothetical protein
MKLKIRLLLVNLILLFQKNATHSHVRKKTFSQFKAKLDNSNTHALHESNIKNKVKFWSNTTINGWEGVPKGNIF